MECVGFSMEMTPWGVFGNTSRVLGVGGVGGGYGVGDNGNSSVGRGCYSIVMCSFVHDNVCVDGGGIVYIYRRQ